MDNHIPELISRESLSFQVAARLQELQTSAAKNKRP